jgi:cytidine deaminase
VEFTELRKRAMMAPKVQVGDDTGLIEIGSVRAALETEAGNVYVGQSINVPCGLGICAERAAMAAMVSAGETRIDKIVAIYEDGTVVPPCGACREFMKFIDRGNENTRIQIAEDNLIRLKNIMPAPWM